MREVDNQLVRAADDQNTNACADLLAAGANPNVALATPLLVNAARAENIDLCRLLIAHGADLEAADRDGVRALHRATQHKNPDCCRMLVEAGADIQALTKTGKTPLDLANALRRTETIALLQSTLEKKALEEAVAGEAKAVQHKARSARSL